MAQRGITVNKTQLVESIAANADISKASAGRALDAFIEAVSGTLQSGDQVALVGFGTFSVRTRAARTGRNPKTGEEIQIAEAKYHLSKQVKLLKTLVTNRDSVNFVQSNPFEHDFAM